VRHPAKEKIRWEEGEFTEGHGRHWCGTLKSWQTQAYGKRMTVRPCRRAWQHTHGHAAASCTPTHPPMAMHALAPTKGLKVKRTHARVKARHSDQRSEREVQSHHHTRHSTLTHVFLGALPAASDAAFFSLLDLGGMVVARECGERMWDPNSWWFRFCFVINIRCCMFYFPPK
jgi:hypothetical protein